MTSSTSPRRTRIAAWPKPESTAAPSASTCSDTLVSSSDHVPSLRPEALPSLFHDSPKITAGHPSTSAQDHTSPQDVPRRTRSRHPLCRIGQQFRRWPLESVRERRPRPCVLRRRPHAELPADPVAGGPRGPARPAPGGDRRSRRRRRDAAAERTSLSIFLAPTFSELTELYAELDAKVVLYCNNSTLNFQSLVDGRMLHVHINHGESDKQSMASNNAKAYDRVFVAGEAAVQRHLDGLHGVRHQPTGADRAAAAGPSPGRRCWRRPRAVRSSTPPPGRATPTTTTTRRSTPSVPRSCAAILAVPDVRVVYKPHPKVTTSLAPADPVRAPRHPGS